MKSADPDYHWLFKSVELLLFKLDDILRTFLRYIPDPSRDSSVDLSVEGTTSTYLFPARGIAELRVEAQSSNNLSTSLVILSGLESHPRR